MYSRNLLNLESLTLVPIASFRCDPTWPDKALRYYIFAILCLPHPRQLVDSEPNLFKDFLEYLKESKVEIPEKLKKHIPDSTKEEMKSQQRRLNRHRTVVNRIENKRKAWEKDKERRTIWLTSIRDEINAQKKKHHEAQKQMGKELEELIEEERKLRNTRRPGACFKNFARSLKFSPTFLIFARDSMPKWFGQRGQRHGRSKVAMEQTSSMASSCQIGSSPRMTCQHTSCMHKHASASTAGSQVKSAPTPAGEPNVRAEAEKNKIHTPKIPKNRTSYKHLSENVGELIKWSRNPGSTAEESPIGPHFSQQFPNCPKPCICKTLSMSCPKFVAGVHAGDMLDVVAMQVSS